MIEKTGLASVMGEKGGEKLGPRTRLQLLITYESSKQMSEDIIGDLEENKILTCQKFVRTDKNQQVREVEKTSEINALSS